MNSFESTQRSMEKSSVAAKLRKRHFGGQAVRIVGATAAKRDGYLVGGQTISRAHERGRGPVCDRSVLFCRATSKSPSLYR